MRKLVPVEFTEEEEAVIQQQLGVQEISTATPKSLDPVNYPVFEVPINKKVLIYVPNHIINKDGYDELRMDKPLIHAITKGNRYLYYRCIADLNMPERGFTGSCPLCEGSQEPWDLANAIIEEKCKAQGLDPEDTNNEDVRNIRANAFSDRELKDASRSYTFPIVVFETVNDDAKTLVQDKDGNISYKIMWYSISELAYKDKWVKALEAMESEPSHPGGNFFVLNYCYTPKKGEPNRRDSARNLVVNARNVKDAEGLKAHLDKVTEGWTPARCSRTVISNLIYSQSDLEEVANEYLVNTRNLLALYSSKRLSSGNGNSTDDSAPAFSLEKKESVEGTAVVDDTDLDISVD